MTELSIKGYKVLVDKEWLSLVSMVQWQIKKIGRTKYALNRRRHPITKKELPPTLMHRIVANAPYKKQVDHKNRNGIDNRKENLRVCSAGQNIANALYNKSKSGFKGVAFLKKRNLYWATSSTRVGNKRKYHNLGKYRTALEAAKAYDKFVIEKFGEFALTNKMLGRYE